jgi:hypothetical protein
MVLCPALTSHSELSETALKQARIYPTTIRIAMGDENPKELCAHIINAARMTLDKEKPGFSAKFMKPEALDKMVREVYMDMHSRVIDASANTNVYLD